MADGRWQMHKWQVSQHPSNWPVLTIHPHRVSGAMGAVGIVQAALGNQQIVEDFSPKIVLETILETSWSVTLPYQIPWG